MLYGETSKWSIRRAAIAASLILAGLFAGYILGARGYLTAQVPASLITTIAGEPSVPPNLDLSPVWKAWAVINDKFVPAAVSTSTLAATSTADSNQNRVWGMIQGLAGSLNDPYTFFLPPSETKQFEDDMNGSFEGVGMEIAVKDQMLTVVSPLKGTPSERAGIKSGDQILKIDGVETRGIDVAGAVKKIRGPHGTVVKLTIMRDGWDEPKEIDVTRDVITIPVLTTKLRPDGIFVIQLLSFTSNSPGLFRSALREFIDSGSTRLILDLRSNPGGYLEAAVDMASWFLPTGKVIVTEDYAKHSESIVHRSRGYNIFNDNLKMAVLVDKGSASASEILADALRFYGKAKIVGERTFGKGSVQELVDITPDTALKITIARWLGPDSEHIPNTGIVPDFEVKMTDEDKKAERDPQMDKAVEILNSI